MKARLLLAAWALSPMVADAFPSRHPLMPPVECRVDSREYVRADLLVMKNGQEDKIATFGSLSPTGFCDLASRNIRNGVVCAPVNYTVTAIDLATRQARGTYGEESAEAYRQCFAAVNSEALRTQPGYLDFIAPARLAPFKAKLPKIANAEVQALLDDPATVFYDELSMVFTYQDSQGDPQGLRSNRVGWDVGSNADEPDIHKLVEYFVPNHFRPPFGTAAGMDQVAEDGKYMLNFWRLPRVNGQVVPVRHWMDGTRWRWTFPVGTYFGEALFLKAPDDGSWHVFEVRTRKRYAAGWAVDAFRPFTKASDMAAAIRKARPGWQHADDLNALVTHLENTNTLVAHTLVGDAYKKIFPGIAGALDVLPETKDYALIRELLDGTPFQSAEGAIWKENGKLETYAASTAAAFSIVPPGYEAGVIPVNEASCNRCHEQAGRELGDLDDRIVLYGELWGEDRIFTWHLFEISDDSFDVSDGSRRLNPRLSQAGMIAEGRPSGDARYGAVLDPASGAPLSTHAIDRGDGR